MCKVTSSAIAADGKAVASALNSLAAIETDPTIQADLKNAATDIVAATANWKTGDPVDDINTAATAAEAVLAVIPTTAPYAAFVAIAVAALDVIIGNLSTQATQTPTNVVANALQVRTVIRNLPPNPYRGLVQIHRHFLQSYRGALVDRWNEQADLEPTIEIAKIS